jgi:hypothetical protein
MSPTLIDNVFDECSKSRTICKLTGSVQDIQCVLYRYGVALAHFGETLETACSARRYISVTQVMVALRDGELGLPPGIIGDQCREIETFPASMSK